MGMSQVQALTGATAEEMKAMSDQAKELGETTRFSATEAAEGMAFLGMAGWETSAILDGMPGLLSLAAAGNMELGRAADITSNIMSAFNIEAEKAGLVADILAHAAANANTDVGQLGEAMKYVAPTANTLGISIEDTTAAIMAVSDAGIQGSQAGRAFGTSLLRLADPTEGMAKEMEKLKVSFFDAEGSMKTLPEIIEELESGMGGYTDQQRAASLATIFGTEAQRHWAILLDQGSKSLSNNSKELKNSEGAAQDMAETMQDNAKGAMVEFRSALEGIGIMFSEHMIPSVTDFIHKGTNLVRKFGDLDEGTQKNIIKMGLFAAAIGPVAIVAGNLTTAIGGTVRAGSSLVRILGGTSGLIARLGSLGLAGPVGLAVAGVGALGGAIYLLSKDSDNLNKVNWKLVESMQENVEQTDNLIERYEELELKNRLSTDEMLRYMDILSELKQASGHDALKNLTEEQEELLKKSGLTNEEMEEFLNLNDKVIEKSPETAKAISEQGNAYALNLDKLKELNKEERERLLITAERELQKALDNEATLLEKQKDLTAEIKQLNQDLVTNQDERRENQLKLNAEDQKLIDLWEEYYALEKDLTIEGERRREQKLQEISDQETLVESIGMEQDRLEGLYERIIKNLDKKNDSLEATRKDVKEVENLKWEYEALILAQAGLTSERGRGLKVIEEELKELEKTRKELEDQTDPLLKNTDEYREQLSLLGDQKKRLEDAKTELQKINEYAEKAVYDKYIHIKTDPSVANLNSILAQPINKRIRLEGYGHTALPSYASGTDSHPGGLFLAGEKGWELGRFGNRWEMLNAGFYDRPRGYEVFTHEQSKKIMRSLNNMPKYAAGTNMQAETNRIASQNHQVELDERAVKQPIIIQMLTPDKRVLAEMVVDDVTEIQDRNQRVRDAFA